MGADLLFSEKNRRLASGRLKLSYVYDRLRNVLDYSFSYGYTEDVLSDNRMFGTLKSDYDLPGRSYLYSMAGAGFDEIREIDFRYELGPGFGYHLVKTTNLVVNTEAGVNYQAQYLPDETEENFYFRFAEDATWKIHPRLSLEERFEYFPQVQNWGKYRLRVEANVRYALRWNLAFVVTVLDEYDTITAAGVGQNDLQVRSSLSVKF
jgi:putative salt-induced outer membrane protein YdiY